MILLAELLICVILEHFFLFHVQGNDSKLIQLTLVVPKESVRN